jgi:hypothetical protein
VTKVIGHAVARLGPTQGRVEDERKLIGRPETGRALNGSYDCRPARLHQRIDGELRLLGMIDVADRLGVAVRSKARDFVEGEVRPGGDDQIVITQERAVIEFDAALLGVHAFRALRPQRDAALGQNRNEVDGSIVALPPANRHQGIGRHKGIRAAEIDDGQLVGRAELRLHFVGHDDATKSGAEDDDVGHVCLPCLVSDRPQTCARTRASFQDRADAARSP